VLTRFYQGKCVAELERFRFVGVAELGTAGDDRGLAVFMDSLLIGPQLRVMLLASANMVEQVGFRLHDAVGVRPGEAIVEDERKSRGIRLTQSFVKGSVDLEKVRLSIGDGCGGENYQHD